MLIAGDKAGDWVGWYKKNFHWLIAYFTDT